MWNALVAGALVGSIAACGASGTPPLATAEPGVIFTHPANAQLDVPTGTRIVVTFSDPVEAGALGPCTATTGAFCVVGPAGPVGAAVVTGDGYSVELAGAALEPGTRYDVFVRSALAPTARNLADAEPLFSFTTRANRPRAAGPALVAVNGAPAATPDAYRPMFETSTIRLVFSEPLDPRTIVLGPGGIELVDAATRLGVPATIVANGIHVAIDPVDDLVPGASYEVRLGNRIADLGGVTLAPATVTLVPAASGGGAIPQTLRTRQAGDPGPARSRSGAERNVIAIDKPLIGREQSAMLPGALRAELGDPKALGGPIAFTIRRGQRLASAALAIKLGGDVPSGLATGEIQIEFLTDAGGRLYRNPYQPAEQRPENERSPLFVDLSMDVAVYTTDAAGNAVIAQTVLGVQATGTAIATDGVLALEAVVAMELGLMGVTTAPTNLVLELVTDAAALAPTDVAAPQLLATLPQEAGAVHAPGDGVELVFSEPIDLDRARAGGIRLETTAGQAVQTVIESHGSTIVVRPLQRLPYSTSFRVALADVADVAGNALADTTPLGFATPALQGTGVPLTVVAVHPGVPCALTGAGGGTAGRCAGGDGNDDLYRPFELPANEPIEVLFSQPVNPATVALGPACGSGSVRVEQLDAGGTCVAAVAGTLIRRDRGIAFVPDAPWVAGTRYRLALISGGDSDCDNTELCGISGDAASFDPLSGTEDGDGGGGNLVIDFAGAPPSPGTYLFAEASPGSDVNGNGFLDGSEIRRDDNRAALRIIGTTGDVSDAAFDMQDCLPATPEVEGCMYLLGAMPVQLGELQSNCPLPGGVIAASCVPLGLAPQAMYATSLTMEADAGVSITTDTGTAVMRIREPAGAQVMGYIVDAGGAPKMVLALDLYMDAPDMSIPLSDHDLHSKPLALVLEGPVTFLADGRIAISLANVADVPVSVAIDAPLGIAGTVEMILPAGEMKLQLLSRPLRGVEP